MISMDPILHKRKSAWKQSQLSQWSSFLSGESVYDANDDQQEHPSASSPFSEIRPSLLTGAFFTEKMLGGESWDKTCFLYLFPPFCPSINPNLPDGNLKGRLSNCFASSVGESSCRCSNGAPNPDSSGASSLLLIVFQPSQNKCRHISRRYIFLSFRAPVVTTTGQSIVKIQQIFKEKMPK